MSDIMLFGVLRMPKEMAMADELSRHQFWDRAQQACDRIAALEARVRELNAALTIAEDYMLDVIARDRQAYAGYKPDLAAVLERCG